MLRSIHAQLDYKYQINFWHELGVPFKTTCMFQRCILRPEWGFVNLRMKAMHVLCTKPLGIIHSFEVESIYFASLIAHW